MIINAIDLQLEIQQYIQALMHKHAYSRHTKLAYQCDLNHFSQWLTERNVTIFNDIEVEAYFGSLINHYKPSTVKRKYATLKSFFSILYQKEPNVNPIRVFTLQLPNKKTLPKTLSINEVTRLLLVAIDDKVQAKSNFMYYQATRNVAILCLLISSGMRISEVSNLNISDYDADERTILIHGKGNKERLMYLSSDSVLSSLKDYLAIKEF